MATQGGLLPQKAKKGWQCFHKQEGYNIAKTLLGRSTIKDQMVSIRNPSRILHPKDPSFTKGTENNIFLGKINIRQMLSLIPFIHH